MASLNLTLDWCSNSATLHIVAIMLKREFLMFFNQAVNCRCSVVRQPKKTSSFAYAADDDVMLLMLMLMLMMSIVIVMMMITTMMTMMMMTHKVMLIMTALWLML